MVSWINLKAEVNAIRPVSLAKQYSSFVGESISNLYEPKDKEAYET